MKNKPACGTCKFFKRNDERSGTCHFNAPLPTSLTTGGWHAPVAEWPHVNDDDWCGEHPEYSSDVYQQLEQVNLSLLGLIDVLAKK